MASETFGSRVLTFYDSLDRFRWASDDVALLSPVADNERRAAFSAFCEKFYDDDKKRVYWLGINPSRVRRTSTGVPYTDGFSLETYCGIDNDFDKSRELSSRFFYQFVEAIGGAKKLYNRHYAGAAYPLSILKKEKYCNYYDKDIPGEISDSIADLIVRQVELGSAGVLVIIGAGKNAKILSKLNDELKLFRHVYVVEHPRYIMQYKSKELDAFIEKYIEVAKKAETDAGFE